MDEINNNVTLKFLDDTAFLGVALQCDPGTPPKYSTDLYRLFIVQNGEIRLSLNAQPVVLSVGHMLTLSPGEVVTFDDAAVVCSLSFHHDFFCVRVNREEVYCDGIVFNRLSGLPIVAFPESEHQSLYLRLLGMRKILENPGLLTKERMISALRGLLLHAADFKIRQSEELPGDVLSQQPLSPLVLKFQHLAESTFQQRKGVAFYCDQLNVTSATLNRRVKTELGKTVTEWINERLAIEARVALRSGDRSIKEVAFELGFDDPLYFSRFFRKHFGLAPSQYFSRF